MPWKKSRFFPVIIRDGEKPLEAPKTKLQEPLAYNIEITVISQAPSGVLPFHNAILYCLFSVFQSDLTRN